MPLEHSPLPLVTLAEGESVGSLPRLLVVCTANICRSPMAEALLRHELERRNVTATVTSAGFLTEGEPAHPHAVAVMAEWGLDLSAHRSRRLTDDLVADQDLILAMERRHVRDLAIEWPDALDHTHTLIAAADSAMPDGTLAAWTARLAGRRDSTALLGRGPDEVPDPMGRSRREFARTAHRLDELCAAVAERITLSLRNHGAAVSRALDTEFVFKSEPGYF